MKSRTHGLQARRADADLLAPEAVQALLDERMAARAVKDFAAADRIRDTLAGHGIAIEDSAGGTTWRRT